MQGKQCRLDLMGIQVHGRIKERHGYAIQTAAGASRQIMGIVLAVVRRETARNEIDALMSLALNRKLASPFVVIMRRSNTLANQHISDSPHCHARL